MMARIGGMLAKVLCSFQDNRHGRSAILRALGLSVLLQVNVVIHFTLVARAVGIEVPVESMFPVVSGWILVKPLRKRRVL